MIGSKIKIKNAFSVAEAMITLLIVSIALSAIAPIFSKRNTAALSGVSKWMYTQGSANITRVSGSVGIGVPINSQPSAKLEIASGTSDLGNVLSIKKNGTEVFRIDPKGTMTIIMPQGGDATNVLQVADPESGTAYAWIKSNNDSSLIPSGAVMFFNLASCPAGWTALSAYNGAFIQIGTPVSNEGGLVVNPASIITNSVNVNLGAFTVNGVGTPVAGESGIVPDLLVPKHITLLACQKN